MQIDKTVLLIIMAACQFWHQTSSLLDNFDTPTADTVNDWLDESNFSQGSVAAHLRCDDSFNDQFTAKVC